MRIASLPLLTCGLAIVLAGRAEAAEAALVQPRQTDGGGSVAITGELKQWHKMILTLNGPFAHERDAEPNPFTDYRMEVVFTHESGEPRYTVPGYFAADGNAANTAADSGTCWRAHLSPDKPGQWRYSVRFVRGKDVALQDNPQGEQILSTSGKTGLFDVAPTDKTGRDFRAKGRLRYSGRHYLQFAGTGECFLKAGADAPESLLAFADFDGTRSHKAPNAPRRPGEAAPGGLHRYEPHLKDWSPGDPTWQNGKGKGLIGALNYLSAKGCNVCSFLTYNAGGDGDNVWPFIDRNDKFHYDCSKLDQWQIVFDHATTRGLYLHFKLQETENDDNFHSNKQVPVPESLDGGDLGRERRLYVRELVARFAHELALNWNLGEENTQTPARQRAFARYLHDTDPYQHLIVVHTYPDWQDRVYPPLLGRAAELTGASLQNPWNQVHQRTLKWIAESAHAGKPWVVANDEQNSAATGVPPDPGYEGFGGKAGATEGQPGYDLHDIRKFTLWGNLMAGGAGVEYYFGYQLPQNDLLCEDWRSRDRSWDFCRFALEFFARNKIPFWEMKNADALVGNDKNDNSRYCLAKTGEIYLVYLPAGGSVMLDLGADTTARTLSWFNPRIGGPLLSGGVRRLQGPGKVSLGQPPTEPTEDWLAVVR